MFGKVFGIERVHVLKKNDRLEDVIEKISIVPESKLVWVEKKDNGKYHIENILSLGNVLTYLCPSLQD